jgi:hypothetical protein
MSGDILFARLNRRRCLVPAEQRDLTASFTTSPGDALEGSRNPRRANVGRGSGGIMKFLISGMTGAAALTAAHEFTGA